MVVDKYGNEIKVGSHVLFAEVPSGWSYLAVISVTDVVKIEKDYQQENRIYFERWYPIEQRGELLSCKASDCVVTTEHNYLVALKRRDEWDKKEAKEND
jgi:hypothetical protein